MIYARHIKASVLKYVTDNLTTDASVGNPEDVDMDADDLQELIYVEVSDIDALRSRDNCQEAEVRIEFECYSRSQTNLYRSEILSDEISTLLYRKTLDIQNYDESDEPVIGRLKLYEPRVQDNSRGQWQIRTGSVTGMFYGLS